MVQGLGFMVSGVRGRGVELRVSDFGFSGFRVDSFGFKFSVQGARRRVQGAGCRVQGAGCRVQGAGCRV